MADPIEIRILRAGDEAVLDTVASDVFDDPIVPDSARAFLAAPHHHLAVAIEGGVVVGFASAVHYLHPDKPAPEMWINEVGVGAKHRARGIGRAILGAMIERARALGCSEAWVLTDRSNAPAMRLYKSLGGTETPHEQVMLTFGLDDEPEPAPRRRGRS